MKKFLLSGALFLCSILSAFAQFSGSGSGTENDPYLIFYADQLNQVRNYLNQDGVCFRLMSDIDLGDWLADNSPSQGWLPIGVEASSFKGVFDGDGHTISNLNIKRVNTDNVGLFGYTLSATIKNITVKGDVTGHYGVGGIVGSCNGTSVTNCHYEGKVTGTENVGGIAGWVTSTSPMTNCSLQGDIKGTKGIGGIVGGTNGLDGTFSALKSNGTISATEDGCGGIFGILNGSNVELSECTTKTTIQGNDYVGGIVGYAEEIPFKTIEKCTSIINLKGNNYVGGVFGGNKTTKPYLHRGKGEIGYSSYYCNDEIVSEQASSSILNDDVVIGNIHLSGNYVGGINGKFDFAYQVVSSFARNVNWYDGERVEGKRTFYKYGEAVLDIRNCIFNGEIQGKESVGGIAGYKDGGEIIKSYSNATITGQGKVGGIIGEIAGSLTDASIKSCAAMNPIVSANDENAGRIYGAASGQVTIGAQGTAEDNSALVTTRVVKSGVVQDVEDGAQHGTAIGEKALKLKANYVAKGWDFNDDWTIQETETFPYKPWQAAPPYISSDLVSQATTISGKSFNGGTVYLQIGDDYTASTRCEGNEWSFTVPALQSGATVKLYAEADDKQQSIYTIAEVGFPGSGTQADPYRIYTADDLQGVYKQGYYKMMNDVNLTAWINNNSPAEGWKAIGKSGVTAIHFDGGGHKVSGLWTNNDHDNNGLFSNLPSGSISHLTVETATGKKVKGNDYTGILVGRIQNATLQDITVKGNAEGTAHTGGIAGAIEQCEVKNVAYEGSVASATDNAYIGGLAGMAEGGSFASCKAVATINATGANAIAGAFLGQSSAAVSECMASGSVVANTQDGAYAAGLVGINKEEGAISDSYAKASAASSLYAAGLVAYNYGNVAHCYATGNVQSKNYGAGLVGYNDGAKAVVAKCLAANKKIDVTDKSGWSIRVLGGFKNGAAMPGSDNYALKDMALSVNGVAKKATDNILDGIGKEQSVLMDKAFYTALDWDFVKVWRFEPDETYPQLATFAIAGYDTGDVNRDHDINVVDVIDIARFVVGTPSDSFVYLLADVNNDDKVNVADAVSLVNVIAGDVDYVASAKTMRMVAADDRLSLTSDGNRLSLNLSGSTAFTACQMDLDVPAEMSAAALSSLRGNGHTLLYNKVADGRYRIVVLSTSNDVFGSGDDALLTMTMSGDASAAKLTDIHFVTPDGIDHIFGTVGATTVTGIDAIGDDARDDGCWYNMQGMKVAAPQHGVYIHNGKKVILK